MNNLESKMLIRVVKYRDNIIFGKYSDYTSALNDGTLLWESIIKDNKEIIKHDTGIVQNNKGKETVPVSDLSDIPIFD